MVASPGPLPFLSATPTLSPKERVKTALMWLTLIPVLRLLLLIASLLVATLWLCVAALSLRLCKRRTRLWKAVFITPLLWCSRTVLFSLGVHWIHEVFHEKKAGCCSNPISDGRARLVVSNHCSLLDSFYFPSRTMPVFVAKAGVFQIPVVGPLAAAVIKPILVPRNEKDRKKLPDVIAAMKKVVSNQGEPPVVIFPEGTTVSQSCVIQFQKGAFMPGVPVQPVVLSYPFQNLDVSWTANDSPGRLILRMVSQVYNRMTVEYLPVYHPCDEEKTNPDLYARNVQQWFAKQTNKTVCNISNYDLLLSTECYAKRPTLGTYVYSQLIRQVETKEAMRLSKQHYHRLVSIAEAFCDADALAQGFLRPEDFAAVMATEKETAFVNIDALFRLLDGDGDGRLSWGEFLRAVGNSISLEFPQQRLHDLVFEIIDSDQSSSLSRDELLAVHHVVSTPTTASTSADELIRLFDKNGDGVIDREEFTELVNSKPDILLAAIHSMIDVFIQSKRSKAVTHRQDPTSAKIVPMNT